MDKSIEISKGVTIEDYELLCDNKNKAEIAEMVYNRFYDRYLKPFSFAVLYVLSHMYDGTENPCINTNVFSLNLFSIL